MHYLILEANLDNLIIPQNTRLCLWNNDLRLNETILLDHGLEDIKTEHATWPLVVIETDFLRLDLLHLQFIAQPFVVNLS